MIEKIKKLAEERYHEKDFKYHILPVVKNSLLLAKKLKANVEVVEVAAYLHDIGRVYKKVEEETPNENKHHIDGAEESKKILKEFGYDDEFIKKVEHCVLTHRGRAGPDPETIEAKIVNCADAMAHFDSFLALFIRFLETTNSFEEAIEKIEAKMKRNWEKKLNLPEAKEIVKEKYEAIMLLLESMKENI